jgi:BACON domain-containing protein
MTLAKISRVLAFATTVAHGAAAFAACPTSAPTVVSPTNGQTGVSTRPTLQWTNVGASKYDVFYAAGATCPNNLNPAATESNPSFTPQTLAPGTKYWWYVIPIDTANNNARCDAQTMACASFTTQANSCPTNPGTAANVSPANGATGVNSNVAFQWTAVSGATGYKVFASVNGGTPFLVASTNAASTNATSVTANVPQGTITWAVTAEFGPTCANTVSHPTAFTVASPTVCNAQPPALVAPSNGANSTSPVTFQWNASAGAIGYKLFLQSTSSGDDFEDIAETASTSVQRLVPPGRSNWYVVAKFAACPDQQSTTFQFLVPTDCTRSVGNLKPVITAPANGATVASPVTLSWNGVSDAVSYRVWAQLGDQNPAIVASTTSTTAVVHLPSGSIEWWVEALLSACPPVASDHSRFVVQTTATCGNNPAPALVSPTGAVGQTVEMRWNGASTAVAYRVWVAPSGQPFGDIALTKDDHITHTFAAGTYSWYVQAFYDGCPAVSSATGQFTVQSSTPKCAGAAPSLLAPSEGATNVTSPVTFAWSTVAGADRYRLFARVDNGTFVLLGDSDQTTLTKALPPGAVTWRVETVSDSCPSIRSNEGHFNIPRAQNCANTPSQLLLPADGATASAQPVTFDWSDVSGASGYVLVVRVNDGAATPITETTETQFTHGVPEGKIEWWVITFVAGCGTAESPHFTFTVPSTNCPTSAPLLLEPRNSSVVTSPVTFRWTPVPGAARYRLWIVTRDGGESLADSTSEATSSVRIPAGGVQWFVEAVTGTTCSVRSAPSVLRVVDPPPCTTPAKPSLFAPGAVVSGTQYVVRVSNVLNAPSIEVQEATAADFSDAKLVTGVLSHTTETLAKYFYRGRAVSSCSDDRGPYSDVITVAILPEKPASSSQQHVSAEFGANATVTQQLFLAGQASPVNFSAHADKPWITITPASGTVPTTGLTLTITADPAQLALGTNTGTITINYTTPSSANGASAMASTSTAVPLSVSLVSPVALGGKNTPPPDSLIIPAVGHAVGVGGSLFESDVRVANTSAQTMTYQLNFTPTATDGTATGNSTTIQIAPGATMALDDILASFFGTTSNTALGTLELRPLTSTSANAAFTNLTQTLTTVASSRTYNFTPNGTFGQYIPAIPFSQFINNTSGVLSLQQIAQSAAYRTNFGLVEGAGEPATVRLTVLDNAGTVVGTIDQSLQAGEHLQLNSLLAANGITLTDGRVEVAVTSPTGRVSAYASTVDNQTNDPLMVSPVLKPSESATRFTLPGVGDFDSGFAHWKSDVRIFDSGTADTPVTMSYYAQGKADSPITINSTVKAGQVLALDNFIASQMPQAGTNTAGSLVVTTPATSNLVVTGRTYTDTGKGTYGQFIPAVTPADSVGLNERSLQLLQLEQSSRMRTNVGIIETSGNAVSVEISLILPDSRVTPKVLLTLAPNEFIQISLGGFGYTDPIYNGRVVVKVTAGSGRVTAYGSVIDQTTQDPAYVPSQ